MRHVRGQSGFSLLEVVLAIFLASVVVSGLAAAFLGMVRINRMTAERQRLDNAVSTYSESLKSVTYIGCGANDHVVRYEADARAAMNAPAPAPSSDPIQIRIDKVEFRDPAGSWRSDCPATDAGTQRITVIGEYQDGSGHARHTRNAQTVVRNR